MPDLFAAAEKSGLSVFFYGSTEGVLKGILQRIDREHPQLEVAGAYSPPFRELSDSEQKEHVARINASGAQIVFVSLGCPKQEIWMARNMGKINAVMIGVGNAFPVYDGRECRAPQWMQKLSLEWFHRLCQEPRRLWKRYLVTNSIFLWLMLSAKWRRLLSMRSLM
jgi:N-acetylglucosaminyldiphosphoundecaprenol N-acetyl-beta-D-mannosaminyltransferase